MNIETSHSAGKEVMGMDKKQFDDVVCVLVEKIKFLSERATTAEEVEALAAVVQALAKFLSCSYRGEEVRWDGRASGDQRKAGSH